MTRREWRNVLLLALVIVVLTTAPYLLAWAKQGADTRFSGSLFGVEDGNSYLGKMRLGARGEWDFSLFYTPEAHDSVPLVFLPYIIPGQIVGRLIPETDPALTPALIGTFHLMRVAFDALLIVAIYRFCAAFLSDPRDRMTATILAALGGGLGWLLALMGQSALPADFYIPEGFSFLILFGLPHLALARAALLFGLLALMRTTHSTTRRPNNHEYRWLIFAALCWLVVGLSVPFYLVIVYCILGAWGLAAWLKERRFPLALFVGALTAAGITVPLFLFYALAFAQNPAFAAWSAQNNLASPAPLQYALAYLPLGVLALFGSRAVWRQPGIRSALIVGWVLIVPILVYLPINVQRRMSEAVIVPLAILAAAGLRLLAKRRVPRLVRGALVTITLLTSALLLLGGTLAAATPAPPLFRPSAEIAALNWLNQHSQPGEIVLSAVETGNVIPAWTHLRTYMGHGPETINWQFKTNRLEYFYSDRMSAAERADFFAHPCALTFACAGTVRYVIFGPLERALAPDDTPAWASGLTQVYNADGYRIYETR
ncbi:MAG: hypothetical protein ABI835_16930 [Chloroflexota bacterium]